MLLLCFVFIGFSGDDLPVELDISHDVFFRDDSYLFLKFSMSKKKNKEVQFIQIPSDATKHPEGSYILSKYRLIGDTLVYSARHKVRTLSRYHSYSTPVVSWDSLSSPMKLKRECIFHLAFEISNTELSYVMIPVKFYNRKTKIWTHQKVVFRLPDSE